MVNSWVFKDDESESESKTNNGPRVCLLLVEGPHFACVEHAQCPLLAHCVSTHNKHTHTNFSQIRFFFNRKLIFYKNLLFTHKIKNRFSTKN